MTAREEHWADAGRKGKPNVVGCHPGRGGGLILTRMSTKTPMAMTGMKTMTSFLDTTNVVNTINQLTYHTCDRLVG